VRTLGYGTGSETGDFEQLANENKQRSRAWEMNRTTCVTRPWQVLLIGGASGAGKTSVSYRLANHFNVGITEVDDFHEILNG
jgi:2-phosphoglycerate kinase